MRTVIFWGMICVGIAIILSYFLSGHKCKRNGITKEGLTELLLNLLKE